MFCHCGAEIPKERLEILPNTDVCVSCTTEPRVQGVPAFGHKTGGGVAIVDGRNREGIRLLGNQYRRVRYRG